MSDDFGLWDVLLSMFWFMLLVAWIALLFQIVGDIIRDRELSGALKAMWVLLLVVLPWIGAVAYLIVRGGSMHERAFRAAQDNEARMRAYVQDAAGARPVADELRELAGLRDSGVITAEEYEQAKVKVLA